MAQDVKNGWRLWFALGTLIIGVISVLVTWRLSERTHLEGQIGNAQDEAGANGALRETVKLEKEKLDAHLRTSEPLVQDFMVLKAEMPYIRQELAGLRADFKELSNKLDASQKLMIEILREQQKHTGEQR